MHQKSAWILAAMLLAASTAAGAADSGFYIGAGVGEGSIKDQPSSASGTLSFDSKDTSYKAFVGYRFTWLPILDLAAEAAYTDFGKPGQTSAGQNLDYKLSGASGAGLVILPLGPLDLFGKVGVMSWSLDKTVAGVSTSKSGTNAVYGVGVGFKIWRIGVRAEYEHFEVKEVDRAEMVSVSAVFQF
jgi:hypothetical protein